MTPSLPRATKFNRGYLWALVGVALTAALRLGLEPVLGDSAPLLAFSLPVALVAVYCGAGPGVLTTFLSAFVGIFLFIGHLGFAALSPADLVRVMLFIAIGLALSTLAGRLAQLRQELQARVEDLRLADAQKDHFIAMLGHELRNPLAAAQWAMTMMTKARLDAEHHAAASQMGARQLANINQLLDALLDVSRLDLGLTACAQEPVDLRAVVGEACEQCEPLYERFRVELACELPPKPVQVIGDRLRLVQALANVLGNAGKYTPAGGQVQLALRVDQHQGLLSVEDNGRGIEAEMLPHVFSAFVQERRSLGQAQGGLGLGLAVVQKIVSLHGGRVTAESAGVGQGSRFVIALPLAPTEVAPTELAPAEVAYSSRTDLRL